jgi:Rrf2 family iron-sulfur cluster assembly transcriptional regulator
MIKLNRTTEYGLMALRHMSRKSVQSPQEVTSAREIADTYGLPFEITAKTLQRLKDTGLIHSAHGARGGYTLQKSLKQVSLAEFLGLMEGPQSIVACAGLPNEGTAESLTDCEYDHRCEIKHLMSDLNARVFNFLSEIPLADLAEDGGRHDPSFMIQQHSAATVNFPDPSYEKI